MSDGFNLRLRRPRPSVVACSPTLGALGAVNLMPACFAKEDALEAHIARSSRRRRAVSVLLRWLTYAAATVTAAVLLFVVGYILVRGPARERGLRHLGGAADPRSSAERRHAGGGTENGSEQEMTSFLKELANETSVTAAAEVPEAAPAPAKMIVEHLNLFYGDFQGLRDINLTFPENQVTALIGPSGCGKSTLLKTLNRMNDLVEGCRVEGSVLLDGADAYRTLDATDLRRRVGMVFQQPNPFPMSIYDNVAFGPRSHGVRAKADLDIIVEESLRAAAIWDELKDRLKKNALGLSGGQQQRLCLSLIHISEPTRPY